jgi:hypothetical protein
LEEKMAETEILNPSEQHEGRTISAEVKKKKGEGGDQLRGRKREQCKTKKECRDNNQQPTTPTCQGRNRSQQKTVTLLEAAPEGQL